jgi:hypothetical protein
VISHIKIKVLVLTNEVAEALEQAYAERQENEGDDDEDNEDELEDLMSVQTQLELWEAGATADELQDEVQFDDQNVDHLCNRLQCLVLETGVDDDVVPLLQNILHDVRRRQDLQLVEDGMEGGGGGGGMVSMQSSSVLKGTTKGDVLELEIAKLRDRIGKITLKTRGGGDGEGGEGGGGGGGGGGSPLDPTLEKYARMLRKGLTEDALRTKMKNDDISEELIAQLFEYHLTGKVGGAPGSDGKGDPKKKKNSAKDDPTLVKYAKMLKMGIPPPAVKQKMVADGVDPIKIQNFFMDSADDEKPAAADDKKEKAPLSAAKDPRFAKYAKMLKLGIDQSAVKQRMVQDGLSPDDVDKFLGGAAPTVEKKAEDEVNPFHKNATILVPSKRMLALHWKKLGRPRVESTWWWSKESQERIELKQNEIEQWFSDAQKDKKLRKEGDGRDQDDLEKKEEEKVEKVEILDSKRVFNLGIILKKINMKAEDCRKALLQLDTEVLGPEKHNMLTGLMPTDDEVKTLQGWKNDPKNKDKRGNLAAVSDFLMSLSDIPRLKDKLKLLGMQLYIRERTLELSAVINVVIKACGEVMNSKAFKKLQLIVINLGNYVNHGTARGNAIGFRVESLDKLERMKSNSPKCKTLLHYVALLARRQFRNVLHLRDEFENVHTASKVSHLAITQQITEITQALRSLENENGASDNGGDFYGACAELKLSLEKASADLKSKTAGMSEKVKSMAEAYGEDVALFDCEKWFAFLVAFVHSFEKAHADNIRQQELEARRLKMDVDKLERQKTRAASKKKKEERKLAFGQKGDPRGGRMRTHTGASISSFSEMGGDQLKFGQSGLRHGRGQSISKKRGSMHSSKRGNGQLDNLIDNVKTGRTLEKDIYQRAQDANAAIEDKVSLSSSCISFLYLLNS